jgi:hypothetical protein
MQKLKRKHVVSSLYWVSLRVFLIQLADSCNQHTPLPYMQNHEFTTSAACGDHRRIKSFNEQIIKYYVYRSVSKCRNDSHCSLIVTLVAELILVTFPVRICEVCGVAYHDRMASCPSLLETCNSLFHLPYVRIFSSLHFQPLQVASIKKLNSVSSARERTIPTGKSTLVGEVNSNFCG